MEKGARGLPLITISPADQDSFTGPRRNRLQKPLTRMATINGLPSVPVVKALASSRTPGGGVIPENANFIVANLLSDNVSHDSPNTYSGWMAPLCGNPFRDCGTFCLAYSVPCVQFGKTHWRLQQLAEKQSPHESAWSSEKGCNSCCWSWLALCYLGLPCLPSTVERSRIRATYGIKGNAARDFFAALCLPCCTLVQNDQEIRAREGATELRNSRGYKKYTQNETTHLQPASAEPMRYIAPMQVQEAIPADQSDGAAQSRHSKSNKDHGKDRSNTKGLENPTLTTKKRQTSDPPARKSASDQKSQTPSTDLQATTDQLAESTSKAAASQEQSSDITDSDSDTVCGTACNPPTAQELQELSYIHDFGDCPVNKSVLEHYEKEEKKAQQQILSKSKINQLRHVLAECSEFAGAETDPKALQTLDLELQSSADRLQNALIDYSTFGKGKGSDKMQPTSEPELKVRKTRGKKVISAAIKAANEVGATIAGQAVSEMDTPTPITDGPVEFVSGSSIVQAKEKRGGSRDLNSYESQKGRSHRLMSCPASCLPTSYQNHSILQQTYAPTSPIGSEDSQATQRVLKSRDENNNSTGSVISPTIGVGLSKQSNHSVVTGCECLSGSTTPDANESLHAEISTKSETVQAGRPSEHSARHSLAATLSARSDNKITRGELGKRSATDTKVLSATRVMPEQVKSMVAEKQSAEGGGISGFFRTKSSKTKGHL